MSDVNFEALLAQHNQEYVEAEVFSQWMPPVGEYLVLVEKVDKGASILDDGSQMLWWSLRCKIMDEGSLLNRKFSIFCSSKAMGIVKGIVEALNNGNPVLGGIKEADTVLDSAAGAVLQVEATKTPSKKKDGREFTNIAILKVLDTQTTTTPVEPS